MKQLDELKEKCVQAMKDVDTFVDEHYEELLDEMRSKLKVPSDWEAKIVSSWGLVNGRFRQSEKDKWTMVIYNDGEWHPALLIA